jgi:ABC-type spermidine/putrescine transport system permease subunit II
MKIKEDTLLPYLFVIPAFLVMGTVVYYPMIYNIVLSFFSEQVFDEAPHFVGLGNYGTVLGDKEIYHAIALTVMWTSLLTALQYVLGLLLALLLDTRTYAFRALRGFYILPWIVPAVVTAIAFRFMYNFDYGLINTVLRTVGLGFLAHAWIAKPDTAFGAAIVLGVWKGFPFYMLMLLAGRHRMYSQTRKIFGRIVLNTVVIAIFIMVPFAWVVVSSFKPTGDVFSSVEIWRPHRFTLPVGMHNFMGSYVTNWGGILAMSVILSLPLAILSRYSRNSSYTHYPAPSRAERKNGKENLS